MYTYGKYTHVNLVKGRIYDLLVILGLNDLVLVFKKIRDKHNYSFRVNLLNTTLLSFLFWCPIDLEIGITEIRHVTTLTLPNPTTDRNLSRDRTF